MGAANSINPYPPAIAAEANTTVVRDGSGNITAAGFSGSGASLTNLPGAVLAPVTFADAGARAAATPAAVGQLGLQIDDGTLWEGTATSAGSWSQIVAAAPTLQEVTDAGNSTTDDIAPATVNGFQLLNGPAPVIATHTSSASISPPSPPKLINRYVGNPGSGTMTMTILGSPSNFANAPLVISQFPTATGTTTVNALGIGGTAPLRRFNFPASGTSAPDSGIEGVNGVTTGGSFDGTTGPLASGSAAVPYALNTAGGTIFVSTSDSGAPLGNSDRTVSLWMNTTTTVRGGTIFGDGNSSDNGGKISVEMNHSGTSGDLYLDVAFYGHDLGVSGTNDGNWHNLVLVFAAGVWSVYLDGSFVISFSMAVDTVLTGTLYIGADNAGLNGWTGDIADLQVYGFAIASGDVATIYAGGAAGGASALPINGSTNGVSLGPPGSGMSSVILGDEGDGAGWQVVSQAN